MEPIIEKISNLLTLMGFSTAKVVVDAEHRKISIFIEDDLVHQNVPSLIGAFDHLVNLILRKENFPAHVVDLNFYRRERERLIVELARAAARKAVVSKTLVELPPMNAYERRLIHVEITTHPELKTESVGMGKDRRVVIKHLS